MKILIILFVCLFAMSFSLMAVENKKTGHKHEEGEIQKPEKGPEGGNNGKADDHSSHDDHGKEEHDNKDKSKAHGEHKEDDHGEGEKHTDHADEGAEENPQVGPNKGIVESNESLGFKLSPEAEKNFKIQKLKVTNVGAIEIPKEAILTAVSEVNLFRFRNGYYKRVDFVKIGLANGKVSIKSNDLKAGDEIIIRGLGFLRIAELAAFGGAPEGHSH